MERKVVAFVTLGLLMSSQLKWSISILAQEVSIFPMSSVIKIPSMLHTLWPGIPLVCGLEPTSLVPQENYTTRWITPGGEIVNSSRDRFFLSELNSLLFVSRNHSSTPATIFIVTQVTYQDAGVYICEGRNNASGDTSPWASATTELQLCLELESNDSTILTTTDDASIEMSCEMGAYIRPDSFLVWDGPGNQRITGGTSKYRMAFTNGSLNAAAFGRFVLVPSRVSTLTVFNPESSDAGTYTCSVVGTNQSVAIELVVVVNNASTSTSTTLSLPSVNVLAISVGSVTAVLGLLAIATIMLCLLRCVHNRSRVGSKDHSNDMYQRSDCGPLNISKSSVDKMDKTVATSTIDCMESNKGGHGSYEREQSYGAVTDGIDDMDRNEVANDIDSTERNEPYSVVTDGIDAMKRNEAYGVVTDGIDSESMERNEAYGVVTDGSY